MCTETHYFYPHCHCTCVYRQLCAVQREQQGSGCHRIVAPPDPRAKPGLCPPCTMVEKDQMKRLAVPDTYRGVTAMRRGSVAAVHRETNYFAGTTWIELWDDRSSEEIRSSDEITQAQDEIRLSAEGDKRTSQDSKSWTDGVRWNAKQSLDELKANVRDWKRRKSLEAARVRAERAESEAAEKESMIALGYSARSSKESWTKSWSSGKTRLSFKQAKPAESGTGADTVAKVKVKVKMRSRWAKWRRWLWDFKKDLVLG